MKPLLYHRRRARSSPARLCWVGAYLGPPSSAPPLVCPFIKAVSLSTPADTLEVHLKGSKVMIVHVHRPYTGYPLKTHT